MKLPKSSLETSTLRHGIPSQLTVPVPSVFLRLGATLPPPSPPPPTTALNLPRFGMFSQVHEVVSERGRGTRETGN